MKTIEVADFEVLVAEDGSLIRTPRVNEETLGVLATALGAEMLLLIERYEGLRAALGAIQGARNDGRWARG